MLLQDVKLALRIMSTDALDSEVEDLIESARLDLVQSGIDSEKAQDKEPDPLIKRAIVLYAKANYGLDSPNADRFQESYDMLKQHLSLSGDYNGRSME